MNLELKDFNIYKAFKIADDRVDILSILLMVVGLVGSGLIFAIMFIGWDYNSQLFRTFIVSTAMWATPTYIINSRDEVDEDE